MAENARTRVLITDALAEEGVELLRQQHEVDLAYNLSREELERAIPEYDALIVRSATRVTSRVIEAGSRLRVIGRAGSGLDNIDVSTARALGVEVLNCPAANSVAVAEHTLALMLALARHIAQADQSM
ncbi:MAG: phosphoglycerate dehydrogenase, partial [Ardenticatenaceae bacterium]